VAGVQPTTRMAYESFVTSHSFVESLWLLGGFGTYVIKRARPALETGPILRALWIGAALAAAALPFLLRSRLPRVALALWGWVLLALVPPLALPFVNPVADRYLFFPSAGLALLLAWLGSQVTRRWLALAGGALLLALWTYKTLDYLAEWPDPRSLWFAAAAKSPDPELREYLGAHYQESADALDRPGARPSALALARVEWAGDARLPGLVAELESGSLGPNALAYRAHLQDEAQASFEKALAAKGDRVMGNLYLRLGKLALDRDQLDAALAWFETANYEADKHTLASYRTEQRAFIAYDIGLVFRKKGDFAQAVQWIAAAEKLQNDAGASWLPDVGEQRRELETLCRCTAPSFE
jgi:hypothetical protein